MTNKTTQARKAESAATSTQPKSQVRAKPAARVEGPPTLQIPAALTIQNLAALMGVDPIEVIKNLMRNGYMLTVNEVVDHELASKIAQSFGFHVAAPAQEERGPGSLGIKDEEEDQEHLQTRPPVVTILGHVDHGKTTLLDYIRKSKIVAGEAGGITQHIGAYQVDVNGHTVTFLDTPGHEAFTAMRARGTQVTDIAVLVVAADDGIMPQTLEAIDHVKAAGVPMIVAINKIDRPEADPERVKRQLAEQDLLVEEWGGDVIAASISALKGEGVTEMLDNVLVLSEVSELKANPDRPAKGIVVEARIDKSQGPLATVLVQTGTLEVGDNIVVGEIRGRIKAMLDDSGKRIKRAGLSVPVEILGLGGLPEAGEVLVVVPNEKSARQMVEEAQRAKQAREASGVTLEDVRARVESGDVRGLYLIVKTDVQGSIDAVRSVLERLDTDETRLNLLRVATGTITESDILLAEASQAIIIGFNSRPEPGASTLASQKGIEIRFYDVIYELIDDVEKALEGLLEPVSRDVVEGFATVRATFSVGRRNKAAGVYVNEGRISRGADIHVLRNNKSLFVGPISSLKHFKDDVREITTGLEGGVVLEGFQDFQEGDILEAHRTEVA